ncbi:MAG: DUF2585 family protein [Bauldia sp.]|nr:DUF2585 family protein [Bauldia sp.]
MRHIYLHIAALLGALTIGLTLYHWGQPLICTCGYVQLWVGSIFSSGNSQHIADWYTLSHIVHGLLIVLIGRLFGLGFGVLYALAIITGVAWEITEHTDWVLDMFRAATLYQGYRGDSVLNSVSDYLWMLGGFFVGYALRTVWVVVLVGALEVTSAAVARDSLALTTLMLVYPIEAIEDWQQAINPNRVPET